MRLPVRFARVSCVDDSSVGAWFEATVKCITSVLPVIWPECELATNPTVEGEATNTCLSEQLKRAGVKVTSSPCVSRACARQSCTGSGAQVTFSGGAVRAAHLDRLAKHLELAKLALEAEEEE